MEIESEKKIIRSNVQYEQALSGSDYYNDVKERVQGKKVFVGVSGGVDSSVSIALLKEMGAEVTGVFIRVWYPDFVECNWKDEREDAMRVCSHLHVPFKEYDLREAYKKNVVDYMIREYAQGRTPNPDVMCNTYVKFDAFYENAKKDGADLIATGHYARTCDMDGHSYVCEGLDSNKDQSYFLWGIKPEIIPFIIFPVGGMIKEEVRDRAQKYGLPTAKKKDSQGICFLGHIDMKDFLGHFVPLLPGNVLNEYGEVIGTHEGVLPLTLGQRHGFRITKKSPTEERSFIVAKDMIAHTITVAPQSRAQQLLQYSGVLRIESLNLFERDLFISNQSDISARIRYRGEKYNVDQITLNNDELCSLRFTQSVHAPTLGQSIVFYHHEILIGGGILSKYE